MRQSQEKVLSKSMFCVEGNSNVVLVTESPSGFREEPMWFPHPVTALEWCLKNGANFSYGRATVAGN